jgi:tRNA pseudouridine38-40 synthase
MGDHSFRAFAKAASRSAASAARVRGGVAGVGAGGRAVHVVANRFLHHMVRYMVGTMVDVARGSAAALGDIAALLAGARDRRRRRRRRRRGCT